MAMTYGKPIFESYWTIVELWIFSVLQPYIGKIGGDYNCYQYDAIYREYKWRPAHKVRIALQRVAPWQFYQGATLTIGSSLLPGWVTPAWPLKLQLLKNEKQN